MQEAAIAASTVAIGAVLLISAAVYLSVTVLSLRITSLAITDASPDSGKRIRSLVALLLVAVACVTLAAMTAPSPEEGAESYKNGSFLLFFEDTDTAGTDAYAVTERGGTNAAARTTLIAAALLSAVALTTEGASTAFAYRAARSIPRDERKKK